MAELSKIFPNVEEYETYVNGGNLPSNVLAVILNEDKTDVAQISFSTNDITGSFETFTCVGDQAYSELQEAYNEKVQELATANATIQTQEATIQDLQAQLATANATITSLQNDITSYDNQLSQI